MKVNTVQLRMSGTKDATYTYLWTSDVARRHVEPGQRAVVPSKLKDDGTFLSLSIGTVVSVERDFDSNLLDPTVQYKYVVQFLDEDLLQVALNRAKIDAAAEPTLVEKAEALRKKHGV